MDLHNEQNDIKRNPSGAFSPLERQLAQLGSLCDIVPLDLRLDTPMNPYEEDPWAQNTALSQTSLGAMLAWKKQKEQSSGSKQASKGQTYWAAGTGYGHDATRGFCKTADGAWDPEAMKAAQVAQDEELQQLVKSITESVRNGAPGSAEEDQGANLASLVSKSSLPLFLARELSASYTNMGDRLMFFEEVLKLVQELLIAAPNYASVILGDSRRHLSTVREAARTFLHSLGTTASNGRFG